MKEFQEVFNFMRSIWWLLGLLITVISFMFVYWKYLRTELRFAKNLKRKIYFLKTSEEKTLQTEKGTIKNLRLFNIEEEITDISNGAKTIAKLQK